MINISGLNKAAVLAALYNAARPLGMGFMHYDPKPMTTEEAAEILKKMTYFDYLKGRVMKVELGKDEFDERWYDRDNGVGTANAIISSLRLTDSPDNDLTSGVHKYGLNESINDAEKRLEEDHSYTERPGVFHLGLSDMAEHLKPKIEEAKKKLK